MAQLDVGTELAEAFSRQTTIQVYANSIWAQFCNRKWESEVQNNYSTEIQDPRYNTSVYARTRAELYGVDSTGSTEPSLEAPLKLKVDQAAKESHQVFYLDELEGVLRGDLFDNATMEASIKMAQYIDGKLYSEFVDSTFWGHSDQAGQRLALGTAGSVYIDRSAFPYEPKGTGASDLVIDALDWIALKSRNNHWQNGETIGGSIGPVFVVMSHELFLVAVRALREKGLYFPDLSRELYDLRIFSGTSWMGELNGIQIMTDHQIGVPASGSPWNIYAFTREHMTFAQRPALSSFYDWRNTKTSGDLISEMATRTQFGFLRVEPTLALRVSIASA